MADKSVHRERVEFKNTVKLEKAVTVDGATTHAGNLTLDEVLLNENGLPFVALGLNPHLVFNFGGATIAAATQTPAAVTADVLTPVNTLLKMSLALAGVASQTGVVTAVQASQIFAGTGVVGVDNAIGTNATPGATSYTNLAVHRITGDISSENVEKTVSTTQLANGEKTMILFTGNKITSGNHLQFLLHASNQATAARGEVAITTSGTALMNRQAAQTDGRVKLKLAATSAEVTILPGSFLYLMRHASGGTNNVAIKGCLRTTGGVLTFTDPS